MKPPEFKTPRFALKPYRKIDEAKFIEMSVDQVTVSFMGGSNGNRKEENELFRSIFKVYENKVATRWFWIWGIYDKEKLIAHFELKETENTSQDELEIVYMVHPDERNKGVMSEVLEFFRDNQNKLKRKIIATVNPHNKVSVSLLEKWGIEKKEVLKDPQNGEEFLKLWLK